jgi:hypothetical protein
MESFVHPICERLRAAALGLPEVSEGTSCVNRAFKVRGKKNFFFLGEKEGEIRVMVKLTDSLPSAEALGDPRVDVGKFGWLTLRFAPDDALDAELLELWVVESFRALAPKAVVKQLDAR